MKIAREWPLPRKVALLAALYFVQGLPFGFQANALGSYLREQGVSLTKIGLAGALALPWSFKLLWAPFVERHGSARFGRRKSWIVPLQGAMALCCVGAALTPLEATVTPLLVFIFALNLFASTQDVAVDGLAVDLLEPKDLGAGNAAQVVGYKVGMLTGGGLLVALSRYVGWHGLFFSMAGLCAAVMAVTFFVRESREGHVHAAPPPTKEIWERVKGILKRPAIGWSLVFVATYKVGETIADRLFGPWLTDHGIPTWQIGLWLGTWGTVASIAGSTLGGVLATRFKHLTAVGVAAGFRAVPLVFQWALVSGHLELRAETVIAITMTEHFFGGMLTVAMFAFMMSQVDRRIGAVHFTLLATVEVLGKTPAVLGSGFIADTLGYPSAYLFAVLASFGFMLLVRPVTKSIMSAA